MYQNLDSTKEHFVQCAYLDFFSIKSSHDKMRNRKILIKDKTGKVFDNSIGNIACVQNYFTLTNPNNSSEKNNFFDKEISDFEKQNFPAIKYIYDTLRIVLTENKNQVDLSKGYLIKLSNYVAMQFLRNRKARAATVKASNMPQIINVKYGNNVETLDINNYTTEKTIKDNLPKSLHIKLMNDHYPKMVELIRNCNISIIKANNIEFCTSDNPVIITRTNNDKDVINRIAQIAYPISPKYCLIFNRRLSSQYVSSIINVETVCEEVVRSYNRCQMDNCTAQVYYRTTLDV